MSDPNLIKIVSDNPAHPHGYYTQFKDRVKPGDVVYDEGAAAAEAEKAAHEPPAEPVRQERGKKKS